MAKMGCTGPLVLQVTIGTLPDDALLEIFDFYVHRGNPFSERWYTLVHVCRRWRSIVFASPRRLNLRLICTLKTPVREFLEIWPAFPIIIKKCGETTWPIEIWLLREGADGIIAALEHSNRVCEIDLWGFPGRLLGGVVAAMQEPFPELTDLELKAIDEPALVLPDMFLGGSAPGLRTLLLDGISFPAARNLLLSASDLVDLGLGDLPHSGYIPPEVMVTCLSAMSRLRTLDLGFRSPRSHPTSDQASSPPPVIRTVLPALVALGFHGVSEYFEDLVARVDTPLLTGMRITFFNELIFDISQLPQFISRTKTFKGIDQACVLFHENFVELKLSLQDATVDHTMLVLQISCSGIDWQLSSLAQFCNSVLFLLSTLECLYIRKKLYGEPSLLGDMDNAQWMELLQPFTTVNRLYLSEDLRQHVAPILEELAKERTTEVLPALQSVFIESLLSSRPVQDATESFVASRQCFGHPVGVHHWETDGEWDSGSTSEDEFGMELDSEWEVDDT